MLSLLTYPNGVKPPKRGFDNGRAADQQSLTQLGVVLGGPLVPREVDLVRGGRTVPRGVGVVHGGPTVLHGGSAVRVGPPLPRGVVDGGGRSSYASVVVSGGGQPGVSSSTDAPTDTISLCSGSSDGTEVQTWFAARQLEENKKKQRLDTERAFERKQMKRAIAQKERDDSFKKIINALRSDPHTDPVLVVRRAAAERQTVELLESSDDDSDTRLFQAPFPPTGLSQIATCGKKESNDDGSIRTQSPTTGAFDMVSSPAATGAVTNASMVTPISSSVSRSMHPIVETSSSLTTASSIIEARPVAAAPPAAVAAPSIVTPAVR